jgi:hypothetical protein
MASAHDLGDCFLRVGEEILTEVESFVVRWKRDKWRLLMMHLAIRCKLQEGLEI